MKHSQLTSWFRPIDFIFAHYSRSAVTSKSIVFDKFYFIVCYSQFFAAAYNTIILYMYLQAVPMPVNFFRAPFYYFHLSKVFHNKSLLDKTIWIYFFHVYGIISNHRSESLINDRDRYNRHAQANATHTHTHNEWWCTA